MLDMRRLARYGSLSRLVRVKLSTVMVNVIWILMLRSGQSYPKSLGLSAHIKIVVSHFFFPVFIGTPHTYPHTTKRGITKRL